MTMRLKDSYERYLAELIARQCSATRAHIDQHRGHFANNRHSAGFSEAWKDLTFALTISRAEDAFVYDLDQNRYLDISMGFGVHLFGHSPAFIKEAVTKQLERGLSLGPLYDHASETARLLCTMTGNERCAFFNSGTEAIMVALRLAKAATGKQKLVIFEGAYHGTFDPLLVIKNDPFTGRAMANLPGISNAMVADTVLLRFGDQKALDYIAAHANQIAAVLTEPVRSRHPEMIDPEFLKQLGRICEANQIAFVLDEVITGFRMHNGGAKLLFGLDPDLVVYGKVLGGGLPIGAVAGKKKYLDFIDGGNWSFYDQTLPSSSTTFVAGTFCHHPLAMAAANASLQQLLDGKNLIQHELNQRTTEFCAELNEFCKESALSLSLASFGSLFRFMLKGRNRIFYHSLLKEKIYLWEGRNAFLSTAHDAGTIEFLKKGIRKVLIEMKACGYFSGKKSTARPEQEQVLKAAISVRPELQADKLEIAFRYLCETICQSNHRPYSYRIVFGQEGDEPHFTDIEMKVLGLAEETRLFLKVKRSLFDGWSLILMLRYLGSCYEALEKNENLPENPFLPAETQQLISQQRPSVKIQPAATIWHYLPADTRDFSFEYLLSCFAQALGKESALIAVPVSGQLLCRKLTLVGQHSLYFPVRFNFSEQPAAAKLMQDIKNQMKQNRGRLHMELESEADVIFNVDNLRKDFSFGGRPCRILPVEDEFTGFRMVCNVVSEPAGFHISIKFPAGENELYYQEVLNRFSGIILNQLHVSAPGY